MIINSRCFKGNSYIKFLLLLLFTLLSLLLLLLLLLLFIIIIIIIIIIIFEGVLGWGGSNAFTRTHSFPEGVVIRVSLD